VTLTAPQLAVIAAIGAAIIPLVVSFLKQEHWPTWIKQAIALVASFAVAAAGIALTVTDWSAINIATLVGLAYTGSQVVYQTYFRDSALETALTSIFDALKTNTTGTVNTSPPLASPVTGVPAAPPVAAGA
jgi:uncharacterized membrane protein